MSSNKNELKKKNMLTFIVVSIPASLCVLSLTACSADLQYNGYTLNAIKDL